MLCPTLNNELVVLKAHSLVEMKELLVARSWRILKGEIDEVWAALLSGSTGENKKQFESNEPDISPSSSTPSLFLTLVHWDDLFGLAPSFSSSKAPSIFCCSVAN